MTNRTKVAMVFLVLIIVLLGGILAFTFFIKPKVTGYTTQRQVEGAQIAVVQILSVVHYPSCQAFPITVGAETVTLVALECLQAPQQQPPPQ